MSNTRFYLLSLVVILATVLSSCTRPSNDTSSLEISLPSQSDNSKLAAGDLDHVFISITGPNMSPIEFQWEKCKNCPSGFTAPSSFSIDVPSGSDRLVQVLAVYEASTSESVDIYYGDTLKTLTSGTQDLPIGVSKVVSNTVVKGGRWAGRYMDSNNSGPTGILEAKFNPGSGKPFMLIDRSHMLGGWFGTIVLEGLNLSYFLNGAALFNDISTSNSVFTPSNQVAIVSGPKYFKQEDSGTTRYSEEGGFSISGYWGPGVNSTTNFVCRENSGAFTKLYTQAVGGSILGYMVDTAPNATAITVQGGMSCGTLDATLMQYTNYLKITAKRIEDNGPMIAGGFLHFFSMVMGNNGEEHVIGFNDTTKAVRIKPIPGAAAGVVDEVIAYKWISVNHQDFFDRSPCEEVASGAMSDWVYAGRIATNGEAEVELSHNVSATEMTDAHVLLCPARGGKVFNAGLMLPLWKWNMNNNGGGGAPATQLVFNFPYGSVVGADVCVPVLLEARDANNNPTSNITETVSLGISTSPMAIYHDSSCFSYLGAGYNGDLTFNNFSTHRFFFKVTSNGSYTLSGTGAGGINATTSTVTVQTATPATQIGLYVPEGYLFSNFNRYICQELEVRFLDVNGYATKATATNFTITDDSAGTTQFFTSQNNCESNSAPSSSLSPTTAAADSSYRFWVKNSTFSGASLNFSVNYVSGTSMPNHARSVTFVQPGLPSKLQMKIAQLKWNGSQNLIAKGICLPAAFALMDNNNQPTAGTAASSATISASSGIAAFSDANCLSPLTAVGFSAFNPISNIIYVKATSSVAESFTLNGTIDSNAFSASYPSTGMGLLVGAPVSITVMNTYIPQAMFQNTCDDISSLSVSFNGQSWDFSSTALPVRLKFEKVSDNSLVTGFTTGSTVGCAGAVPAQTDFVISSNNLYLNYNDVSTPYFGMINVYISVDQGVTYQLLGQTSRGGRVMPTAPTIGSCGPWNFNLQTWDSSPLTTFPYPMSVNLSTASNRFSTSCTTSTTEIVNFPSYSQSSSVQAGIQAGDTVNMSITTFTDDFRFLDFATSNAVPY